MAGYFQMNLDEFKHAWRLDRVLKWDELEEETVFRVVGVEKVKSNFGKFSLKLTLLKSGCYDRIKVWCCTILYDRLESFQYCPNKGVFIVSEGQRTSKAGKTYNSAIMIEKVCVCVCINMYSLYVFSGAED